MGIFQNFISYVKKIKHYIFYGGFLFIVVSKLRKKNQFTLSERIIYFLLQVQPKNFYAWAEYAINAFEQKNYELSTKRWQEAFSFYNENIRNKNRYLIKASDAFTADDSNSKYKKIILNQDEISGDVLLALANCSLPDKEEWFHWVNLYLQGENMKPLIINESNSLIFFNLSNQTEKKYEEGPLVSIILTAYNIEEYIGVAIKSILEQSWKNFELIIVDDASTDNTSHLIDAFAKIDNRIKIIRNPVNVGTYISRNIALLICKGQFITTHDADDWAHTNRITEQVKNLCENGELIGNLTKNIRLRLDGFFESTHWGTFKTDRCSVSFMFRAEKIKQIFGFWDSVRVSADVELIERVIRIKGKNSINIIDKPLIFTLRRKNSLTTIPETLGVAGQISPVRSQYRIGYTNWHKYIKDNNCKIEFPLQTRPFKAPLEIIVPLDDVVKCFNESRIIYENISFPNGQKQ